MEVSDNLVKLFFDNIEINLIYLMRSPEKEHFPEKVSCKNNIIRAKFPQGIITDHLNQTTGELIVNRE